MKINKNLISNTLLSKSRNTYIKNKLSNLMISKKTVDQHLTVTTDITEVLKDILKTSGFNVTSENLEMLQSLMDNNLSLDNDTLSKLNKGIKLFNILENNTPKTVNKLHSTEQGLELKEQQKYNIENMISNNNSLEKSIFLLKNEIPINSTNTYLLESIVKGEGHLLNILTNVANSIYDVNDTAIKNQLINYLLKDIAEDIKGTVFQRLPNNITHPISECEEIILNNKISNKLPTNNITIDESKLIILKENIQNIEQKVIDNTLTTIELNNILQQPTSLTQVDILHIATYLFKDKPILQQRFIDKLNESKSNFISKDQLISTILNKISLDCSAKNLNYIDDMLDKLNKNFTSIEKLVLNTPYSNIHNSISYAKDTLDFLNLMNESTYIPLPISVGEHLVKSELFIFKDKKTKNKSKNSVSALVALNTLNLGRVETYIQKNSNILNLQFRLQNMDTEVIIKANLDKLNNLLKDYNYIVQSYSIIPLDTPFNILSKEPLKEDSLNTNQQINNSFDTRA